MKKRVLSVLIIICVLFAAVFVRTAFLATSEHYTQTATAQSSYTINIWRGRGMIYDRSFTPLVENNPVSKAIVMPFADISQAQQVTKKSADELEKLLSGGKPMLLDAYSTPEVSGIKYVQTNKRYSENQLLSHVIGHLDAEGAGAVGIERAYDDFLSEHGSKSVFRFKVDGRGQLVVGADTALDNSPDSAGVVLTIDKNIQQIIEDIGQQSILKGAIVVLDIDTAEIRGIASFPSFSHENLGKAVADTANAPMFNRAFGAYNVGSTFKIAACAAALEDDNKYESFQNNCYGNTDVIGKVFHCHLRSGHGLLDMSGALRESCNTYFVSLGAVIGGAKIRLMASDMGYGKAIELAPRLTASGGVLPTLEQLYNPADVANLSFGQGMLLASPLTVANAMRTVVAGGRYKKPSLVLGKTKDGKNITEPYGNDGAGIQAMSAQTADKLKDMLIDAVMKNSISPAKPQSGMEVGGKSGTAQTGQVDKNGKEILQSWFCGFFPAVTPKYVVAVLYEDGEYNNNKSIPVFREIAEAVESYNNL